MLARDEDTAPASSSSSNNSNDNEGTTRTTTSSTSAAAAAGLAAAAQQLASLGVAEQLLAMLKHLGPPPKAKQQQEQPPSHPQQPQHQQPQYQAPQQHQQPYTGCRADVVAVLSNLVYNQKTIQDTVMAAGGIELLLSNCVVDEASPLAREYALWAIRNMCEGNEAVQQYVSQFQAVEAVQSPELDRMGMQVELDGLTHKLKLVKKKGQESSELCVVEEEGD